MVNLNNKDLLDFIISNTYHEVFKWKKTNDIPEGQYLSIESAYASNSISEVTCSTHILISANIYVLINDLHANRKYIRIDIHVSSEYNNDYVFTIDSIDQIDTENIQVLSDFVHFVISHATEEEDILECDIDSYAQINDNLDKEIEKLKEERNKKKEEKEKMLFNRNDESDFTGHSFFKIGKGFAVIIFIVILLASSFTIIDTGERGVVLRLGEFKYVMNEGINFKLPMVDRVIVMSIRDVTYNSKSEVSSKDMQTIEVDTTLIYSLDSNKLGDIYKTYGNNIQNVVIKPTMAEVVNAIVAEYNIESFVEKRAEISKRISDAFVIKIQNSGINVKSLLITNHDFSNEFDKAIEAKKVAEQGALKAKYDLEKTRLDAEAQTLKQKSLNDMVLQEKAIDKWDGHLPTYMGDGRNLPFLIKQ